MQERDDFLIHYGVKGQKWGVRRYQNEDHSLTSMGRRRYGIGKGAVSTATKVAKRIGQATQKAAKSTTGAVRNKISETRGPSHMSDAELNERVNRLRKEAEYARLKREIEGGGQNGGGGKGKNKGNNSALSKILIAPAILVASAAVRKVYQAKVDDLMLNHGKVKMKNVMNQLSRNSSLSSDLLGKLTTAGEKALNKHSYGTATAEAASEAAKKYAKDLVRKKFRKGPSLSSLDLKHTGS